MPGLEPGFSWLGRSGNTDCSSGGMHEKSATHGILNEQDLYLFGEGTHARLYDKLGCHLAPEQEGAHFRVWAPNAISVSVIGDWNHWDPQADPLQIRADHSGLWEGQVLNARHGQAYKYRVHGHGGHHVVDKADPFAVYAEHAPAQGSRSVRPSRRRPRDAAMTLTTPTVEHFPELLLDRTGPCVSIYLPTGRRFPASQQDVVRFRNLLRQAGKPADAQQPICFPRQPPRAPVVSR